MTAAATATQLMSLPSLIKRDGMRSAFDRKAAAMHWWPELLMSLILALRMMLMANAVFPDRIRLWSLTCDVPRDRNLQQRLCGGRQNRRTLVFASSRIFPNENIFFAKP